MDAERDRKLEELFQLAVDLSPAEREDFIERHCEGELELAADLRALLREDDEGTKDFLVSPVLTARERARTNGDPSTEPGLIGPGESFMPERIGRYRILERIGEGGMGSVYLAEQVRPVRRRVALKIVKPGMDTERVVHRFEMERQALAMMDHPGIARIFDGGATDSGRPYFVMEYAPGLPITKLCDEIRASLLDRLQLFCRVCEAVQHAHQKGIIHRDIKPTNVLVSLVDGRPEPKVIDFGIARATSETPGERRGQTRAAEVVGTCYYMSPEQADPADDRVDTRSDIYSLGVLLYELLAGVLPFDAETLRNKTAAEVQAILRDVDPAPPSARAAGLGADARSVAERRGLEPSALVSRLSGDLDWIVLKALDKDPGRRYATAAGLAADIRRHLADEPVVAGPPEVSYRLKKFVRRNRVAVTSGVLVFLGLVAGVIGATWGLVVASRRAEQALESKAQAERAERLAESNRSEAEAQRALAERLRAEAELQRDEALRAKVLAEQAEGEATRQRSAADDARRMAEMLRGLAEGEALQARIVTDFLVETVALADPEVSMASEVSLERMLLRAGERVEQAFQGFPSGEATVRKVLGEALHSLGRMDAAEEHLRRALNILKSEDEPPLRELYEVTARLAQVYGESDSRDSYDLFEEASQIVVDLLGERSRPLARELAHLIEDVKYIDFGHALPHLDSVRQLAQAHLAPQDPNWIPLADVMEFLGYNLGYHWGSEAGVPYLEEALSIRRRELPATHPRLARGLNRLVTVLNLQGLHEQAEALVRESLDIYVQAFPPEHWLLAETRSLLGECLSGQGEFVAAEDLLVQSHADIVRARGPRSRAAVDATYRLVRHFEATGRPEAAREHRRALAEAFAYARNAPWSWGKQAAAFEESDAELVDALRELDSMMMGALRTRQSPETLMWQVSDQLDLIADLRSRLPVDDPRSVIIARLFAEYSEVEWGQTYVIDRRMGEETLRVLLPLQDRLPEPVANAHSLLGRIALYSEAEPVRAEVCFGQAWEVRRNARGLEDDATIQALRDLVRALVVQGRFPEAKELVGSDWEECMVRFGPRHRATMLLLQTLSDLFDGWGRPSALETYLEKHLRLPAEEEHDVSRLEHLAQTAGRSPGFSQRLYELALSASRRCIELHPTHALHRATAGKLLYRLGRHAEAAAELERALAESEGRYPEDWLFLALAREGTGNALGAEAARAELQERLETWPHDFELDRFLVEAGLLPGTH